MRILRRFAIRPSGERQKHISALNGALATGVQSTISANLFCKHSQVTFVPYRVVLKDERRTSNIERPTSNEKLTSNIEHSTPISVSLQPFDSAQGREPVERPC
jgi:hypothetical protein